MTSRRTFLAGLSATAVSPGLGWASLGNPVVLSAAQSPDGLYGIVGLTETGSIAFKVPLPARGHAAAAHPDIAEAVAIARRPGTFAKVIDCANGQILNTLKAPVGHHFYGHGAFSADGKHLFTTENQFDTGAGRIGVWDRTAGYKRVGEFSSGGVGPHEILKLPSGLLAVANGGIRTHPSTGRKKLNLESMQSNLSVFTVSGVLTDRADVAPDDRLNSLRHIACSPHGTVVCGFQWQGDPYDTPQLVALYQGDGKLRPSQIEDDLLRGLNGYTGSVSAIGRDFFVASSPRGGRLLILDATGRVAHSHQALDVCGIGNTGRAIALVTDGNGHVYRLNNNLFETIAQYPLAFDNHLVALT